MPLLLPDATTRTATAHGAFGRAPALLQPGDVLPSPESGLRYRVGRLVGAGGFGQVYLAERVGRSTAVPNDVCIKVSAHLDGWVREAYFGQLLDGHPRAIRLYDAFPTLSAAGGTLYCLVLEYAHHGDLSAFLRHGGKAWTEIAARR